MKKTYLLLAVLLCFKSFSQAPAIEWTKSLGGSMEDFARSAKQTSDGGYIIAGDSYSNNGDISGNNGNADAWVVKLDNNGNIQWQQHFGNSEANYVSSIEQTTDGGYVFAGTFYTYNAIWERVFSDLWVVKIDASGTILWDKKFGGVFYENAADIKQTSDGGYIVAGATTDNIFGEFDDVWILKLDSDGNSEWEKTYGGSDYESPESIQLTSDGGYIIGADSSSNDGDISNHHGDLDYWIIKLNALGNMEWEKSFGGSNLEFLRTIRQTNDGGYAMIGTASSNDGDISQSHGNADFWVVKIDSSGNLQWEKTFGGSLSELATSLQQTADGGYIIGGYTYSTDGDVSEIQGGSDYWVLKLNNSGNIQWQRTLGGTHFDQLNDIIQTTDDRFVLSGSVASNDGDVIGNHGDYDFWVVKLESGLNTKSFNTNELALSPNPASDFIQVRLPEGEALDKISITDITGKIIFEQSSPIEKINVATLASGVYIIAAFYGAQKLQTRFIKN